MFALKFDFYKQSVEQAMQQNFIKIRKLHYKVTKNLTRTKNDTSKKKKKSQEFQ